MLWYSRYKNLSLYYTWTRQPPARCWRPPPMRIPGPARRMPSQLSKTMPFVLSYCFFLFLLFRAIRYLPLRRPISREDAHRMYPWYPRVFLYVIIYCPLPSNLCESGWGYHCRVLVWLLALYAKLNCFFLKNTSGLEWVSWPVHTLR